MLEVHNPGFCFAHYLTQEVRITAKVLALRPEIFVHPAFGLRRTYPFGCIQIFGLQKGHESSKPGVNPIL
jgi:hypothetical protein